MPCLDEINEVLYALRNIGWTALCILCAYLFLRQTLTFKFFTIYIVLNLLAKLFTPFLETHKILNFSFFFFQHLTIFAIYYRLITKKRKMFTIFGLITVIIMLISLLFFDKVSAYTLYFGGTITSYLFITVAYAMYRFQLLNRQKRYYHYFTKGLFLFVVLTVFLLAILGSISLFAKSEEPFTYLTPLALVLDMMMQVYFYREWWHIFKTKEG